MKFVFSVLIIIFLQNCSFDNKSGIWKNENSITKKDDEFFKDFENVNFSNQEFEKIIPIKNNFYFKLPNPVDNKSWSDIYYNQSNSLENFKYDENFKLILKSKKLSKFQIDKNFLIYNKNLISTDEKGNIIFFSIEENRIISKFNFYRKKHKKIVKKLNIIIENDLLYVSDNLGYLYAINYLQNKIIWAKKYDVAFRSNIKIYKNKIITSNQDNNLYFFNKNNGSILNLIPTEETVIKNNFKNNLSLNKNMTFFINTFGSLYAINNDNMRIKWFVNLNQSLDLNPTDLFIGSQIVNGQNELVLSSNFYTYIIDQDTGSILHKKSFITDIRPIILKNYLFMVTRNNYLVATNLENGNIIYSYDLNSEIAKFLKIKKKQANFSNLMILNNKIVIFLKNSFILFLDINGNFKQIRKLPTKIYTSPVIVNKNIIYLDKKNKLSIIN